MPFWEKKPTQFDTNQDKQITQLQKDITTLWSYIQQYEKNMPILIKNNNAFIEKNNAQATFNKQVTDALNSLIAKDKEHDSRDIEHDKLLEGLKNLTKKLETATE